MNKDSNYLFCPENHRFDMAKSGYVNLLLSQQNKLRRHGDDKLMVRARSNFLDKGYYNPLLEQLQQTALRYVKSGCTILDAGCGECWYTSHIDDYLTERQISPKILAVDISKDALAAGAKRRRTIECAVASVFRLPVKTASCDIILSVFAPFSGEEFRRVLKDGGVIIRVIPLERHLMGLKTAVYDRAYENVVENTGIDGFELLERQDVRGSIRLENTEDILNAFTMTPYYYKTGAGDQEKLKALPALDTEIEFGIFIYRKKQRAGRSF